MAKHFSTARAEGADSDGAQPEHQLEIELTFDVEADTPLPHLASLPGVAAVGEREVRELDAAYLDTADLAIARAASALRRRTGGPDAGWHLKTSAPEGRHEYQWPLDADGPAPDGSIDVPAAVRTGVVERVGLSPDALLEPIARVRNERHAYAVTAADGGLVAEFTDDHVTALDHRRGVETSWREWEFELGPAAPADTPERARLLDAATRACLAAGARPPASGSKLQRALGG